MAQSTSQPLHHEFPNYICSRVTSLNRTNSLELVGKTAVYTEHHPAPLHRFHTSFGCPLSGYESKLCLIL